MSKKIRCFYAKERRGPDCDGCDHNTDCAVDSEMRKLQGEIDALEEELEIHKYGRDCANCDGKTMHVSDKYCCERCREEAERDGTD